MVIGTFHIPKAKSKAIKIRDGTDVAARHFVYKLYDTTGGEANHPCFLSGVQRDVILSSYREASALSRWGNGNG